MAGWAADRPGGHRRRGERVGSALGTQAALTQSIPRQRPARHGGGRRQTRWPRPKRPGKREADLTEAERDPSGPLVPGGAGEHSLPRHSGGAHPPGGVRHVVGRFADLSAPGCTPWRCVGRTAPRRRSVTDGEKTAGAGGGQPPPPRPPPPPGRGHAGGVSGGLWPGEPGRARVDYIHGRDEVRRLAQQGCGRALPDFQKAISSGAWCWAGCCHKDLSMGHAREKRYYLECRKIL